MVAVISGASSGIGLALAEALAAEGVRLHLLGRDEARLAQVVASATAKGADAIPHRLELTSDTDVRAFCKSLGQLDILIHSAGVVTLGEVETAAISDLDKQYQLNLRAPYLLTQNLLPKLKVSKGQVVFINSGAGLKANAGWSQYAATKHGLKALADSLRLENPDLRVLSVYPGRTASPMQESVREMEGEPYAPDSFIQPEDIALQVVSALRLPRTAQVTDLSIRPSQ